MSWRVFFLITASAIVLAVASGTALKLAGGNRILQEDFHPADAGFSGSRSCAQCHEGRVDSWYATYHRTMTQEAGAHSVQGKFDGQNLDYWGMRVRPIERDGRYFFEYIDPISNQRLMQLEVERTVGSNRYQQYLTRLPDDGTYLRLHYLWHNGDQRWVHMNAAFLGTDDADFDQHVAIWNQNCIFCHNTGPVPGMRNYDDLHRRSRSGQPVNVAREGRFDSKVAELGIACEACHGPGATHIERAEDFWVRTAMRLSPGRDNSIVNPVRLDHARASQVCGQCHAQRVPAEPGLIRDLMHTGPTYRPGQELTHHVHPIWQDTPVPGGDSDLFKLRFWNDGTPRLSAYEYQGMVQSPCHQAAELTCMDCHTMHAGDPAGQLTDRNRGNAPCLRCHQDFRREPALVKHTRHDADSPGSQCYNCHMPHLKYGVMDIHRSHRIEVPDAVRDAAAGRPNACLLCHMDQSSVWAAEVLTRWPSGGDGALIERHDGLPPEISEAAVILGGDPVQKAVLAWRAGHRDNHSSGRERAWKVPILIAAMGDIYPASRRFAGQSLDQILADWPDPAEVVALRESLAAFDFIADERFREPIRARLLAQWHDIDKSDWAEPPSGSGVDRNYLLPRELEARLVELGRRLDKQISIGE